MSDRKPDAGQLILGTFFLLFGICILLVGGGCTIFILTVMWPYPGDRDYAVPLILLSLATAGAGILSIRFALRVFRGPDPDAD